MIRKIFLSAILFLIIVAIGGYFWWQYQKNQEKRAPQKFFTPTVTVTTVNEKLIQPTIEALGTVRADEAVTITANVTEYVKKIYFDDGHFVKKGDILVELKSDEERARLRDAIAQYKEAQKQHRRTQKLSRQNFISQAEHDTQVATLQSTAAKIEEIKATIKDRLIRAPFDGILGFRKISEGTLVEPGDEIVTIDKINPVKIDFTLPEKYLGSIKKKQTIHATSVAFPNQIFKGKIRTISSRIDPNTRAVMVRALIDNPKFILRPGMLLTIELTLPRRKGVMIPEEALVPKDGKQYVYVLNNDNTVRLVEVELGKRKKGYIEILSGLSPKTKIVIEGGFKLRPGQRVIVHSQKNDGKETKRNQ